MLAKRATEVSPASAVAYYAFASELFRVQDDAAGIVAFEKATTLAAPGPGRLAAYAKALISQGRAAAALALLQAHLRGAPCGTFIRVRYGEALQALGRHSEAIEVLRDAIAHDPRNVDAAQALYLTFTAQEDWWGLLEFADEQERRDALTMPVVLARIAGLVGVGRAEEAARLLDGEAFVSIEEIVPPEGFLNLAEFNAALVSDIASTHKSRLSGVPRLRLAGGTQVEDLDTDSSSAMSGLFIKLKQAIESYVSSRIGPSARIIKLVTPELATLEAWALMLGSDDAQEQHYHLYSSVAGVYYVAAPEQLLESKDEDGCLVIPCAWSPSLRPFLAPKFIKPEPGRLVLFPGYFPHRTMPTRRVGSRISIAFDVLSAQAFKGVPSM